MITTTSNHIKLHQQFPIFHYKYLILHATNPTINFFHIYLGSQNLKHLFLAGLLVSALALQLCEARVALKDLGIDLKGVGIGMGTGVGIGLGGSSSGAGAGSGSGSGSSSESSSSSSSSSRSNSGSGGGGGSEAGSSAGSYAGSGGQG